MSTKTPHSAHWPARVSMGAALIAVCAWLTVPAAIPFTMQTFAVCLIAALFGRRTGHGAVGMYLFLGAVGLPVFAGFQGGFGVLFGLARYRYEFTALLMHAEHMEAVFGVGPHTISVPRIRRADDIDPTAFENGISDDQFAKIVACIRIAVPYTGMIVSTRESKACRERVLHLGISQISGGSRTSVGGYVDGDDESETAQFDVSDPRPLDEVVKWLMELGYLPSFCTACYREGRTGDRFMSLCKSGQIQNCCHPNALMTLKEYLEDYARPETKRVGEALIQRELAHIPNEKVRQIVVERLEKIREGSRDFRF